MVSSKTSKLFDLNDHLPIRIWIHLLKIANFMWQCYNKIRKVMLMKIRVRFRHAESPRQFAFDNDRVEAAHEKRNQDSQFQLSRYG